MDQATRSIVFKVVLDVVCLLLIGFPILIFFAAGKPYERGFFCDDESLRHPFKDSTVPNWVLYIFGLGLPIATIVATELLWARKTGRPSPIKILKYEIPGWAQEVYKQVGVFGFGAAASQLTTDIGKYAIGRLRPHFFEVCAPSVDCNDPRNHGIYITNFYCNNPNQKLVKDVRLSFPSGHSSFSMYCMLYLTMYLQSRFTWRGSKLLKHVLQFLALSLAVSTALSRISDYKHHWSDVLSGVVLGIIVAVLIVVFVSDLFPAQREPSSKHSLAVTEHDDTLPAQLERLTPPPVSSEKPTNGNGQQNSVI